MDKVLLVSVIALTVALLSMLVNLALVWKISDLKNRLEWVELTVNDRTSQLHKDDLEISNQLNKLECDTKDAFEKLTNHLTRHDDQIDKVVNKYGEMETRVAKHTGQLEDLGNFAGITTGELRVLEQKIYDSCKPKELPEPEPITKQISERIEEASLKVNVKTNNIEINSLGNRVSILENKIKRDLTEQNDLVTRMGKIEHRVSEMYKDIDKVKLDMVYHTLALNSKIVQVVGSKDVAPNDVKTDRRRKDDYYRKPNKGDVFK
jgi:hypothetical protein